MVLEQIEHTQSTKTKISKHTVYSRVVRQRNNSYIDIMLYQ